MRELPLQASDLFRQECFTCTANTAALPAMCKLSQGNFSARPTVSPMLSESVMTDQQAKTYMESWPLGSACWLAGRGPLLQLQQAQARGYLY